MKLSRGVLGAMVALSLAACGPKADDGAAAPGGGATTNDAAPAAGDAAGGAAAGDAAAGDPAADDAAAGSPTEAVGQIASGTAERPTAAPEPTRPVQQGDMRLITREDLVKTATVPLYELPPAGEDDEYVYHWVVARPGETDPMLPLARVLVSQGAAGSFVISQWAAKDGAMPAEEGAVSDVTVGGAPAKLYVLGERHVVIWDKGETRLRMQSTNVDQERLLEAAAALVPLAP